MLWATPQFGFVALSDRFTTGSSIMPQKRNPDAAELVRAKTGRIVGALTALLVVMKGLPLAYSKDMQEDKEQVFDALPSLSLSLAAMTGMVVDMTPNLEAMRAAAGAGYSTATDLADWLVREAGLPFREAHHVTGRDRRRGGEARRRAGGAAARSDAGGASEDHARRSIDVLSVEASVASRTSDGGTAPKNVRAAARAWIERLAGEKPPESGCVSAARPL